MCTHCCGGSCKKPKAHPFLDDKEKMLDFFMLSKEAFLESYSYLTEEEYDETERVSSIVVDSWLQAKLHEDPILYSAVKDIFAKLPAF